MASTSNQMASTTYPFTPPRWTYDVFLSFRGEDTRNSFIQPLYSSLHHKGIFTFKDDIRLQRGKSIAPELLSAIEQSRFSVVVFSKNYANSTWCLDELAKIVEWKNVAGLIILPVFYDVDPSDVRKQRGTYGEAFSKYELGVIVQEDMEKVKRWREALFQAASISGWDLRNMPNGQETKFIQSIVEDISSKLKRTPLNVAMYEVGIDSRAKELSMLLENGSDDVRIVGICGIGGIGKTTVAKAVFNLMSSQFDSRCFLASVREVSKQRGLAHLQEQLLSEILMANDMKINNVDRGINVIKDRLSYKKVLVVLDDVDQLNQLENLAGKRDWFGVGSRIIITTRDEHLLLVHEVDEIYAAKLLDDDEALQLFSWHAFQKNHPGKGYMALSYRVVYYAQGLPLALKVLGSFLYDKRSIPEWESALQKLKRIPNRQILDVLRLSIEGLDDSEKDIFLDIACFFKGVDKDYVIDILESCGFYPHIGITVLIHRSLITIVANTLWIHDLIQEMGMEIVREESPRDLGKRSRLWCHEDIYKVLTEDLVTESIEGIMLNLPRPKDMHVSADTFKRMKQLRLLKVSNVRLSGTLTHLSNELSYLNWHGYPLKSLPPNFNPEKLVELSMCHSHIKQFWKGIKVLEKLKFLNLSKSQDFERTPDFSSFPCLERLYLDGCTSLVEVHPSIGVHERLVELNLMDCKNLRSLPRSLKLKALKLFALCNCSKLDKFPEIEGEMDCLQELLLDKTAIKELPSSIGHLNGLRTLLLFDCKKLRSIPSSISNMRSLNKLILRGCSKLVNFPDIPRKMENLRILKLDGTGIRQLPPSIIQLNNLRVLGLNCCKGPSSKTRNSLTLSSLLSKRNPSTNIQLDSIMGLFNLRELNLSDCNILEGTVPDLGCLPSLVNVDLSRNNFVTLPESIIRLTQLHSLNLEYCTRLRALPTLPPSIGEIDAHSCTLLETFSIPPSKGCPDDRRFIFTNCHKLVEEQGSGVGNVLAESQIQGLGNIVIPGSVIPHWFNHQNNGSSVSLRADPHSCSKLKGIVLCGVLISDEYGGFPNEIRCNLKVNFNEHSYSIKIFSPWETEERRIVSDHLFIVHITRGKYEFESSSNDSTDWHGPVLEPWYTSLWIGPRVGPVKNLTYAVEQNPGPGLIRYDWCDIEASFSSIGNGLQDEIKKCGIHLLLENDEKDT